MESASYRQIATAYGLEPDVVLFLSDVPAELAAAAAAGMRTALVKRPGNKPVGEDCPHPAYRSFDELSELIEP